MAARKWNDYRVAKRNKAAETDAAYERDALPDSIRDADVDALNAILVLTAAVEIFNEYKESTNLEGDITPITPPVKEHPDPLL